MPLHPDLDAFLALVEAGIQSGRQQPMHRKSVHQARADYEAAAPMLDLPPDDLAERRALEIPTRDGARIGARLYAPAPLDAAAPQPVLLYFHGGGYCVGSLDSHDTLCSALAARTPCCVLAVDYRLAPEHRFPTAFEDAADAYDWLLQHGPALGLATNRLAVGGDSAGGTLAAALALRARQAARAPCLQVLLYPCTSAHQDGDSHRRFATGYLLEGETLQWMFGHTLNGDHERQDWRFAPLQAADVSGAAPALVVIGDHDPLLDEGMAYAEKLRQAGVPVQLDIHPGMVHDFLRLGMVVAEADQARTAIAARLAAAMR
ncbi:alpha/beta hydrolase [Herbaspirillum seropedicae]|uniref:Esterase/lipase protein n=1 Tax=Herbaspirillum seropedicae (strain SmR1) TaxID=757424 RepID=D8IVA4_HERSS|nr:alpha/beta hydrolase [Herbaspirillum seropedicae]ADJ63843.1 esterase/lipase protein [Herbaspirillum seropedicae SmR1]AKN65843.1 esterase [Herbaspirillum seropedicae]NQE28996.1 esterase [Herbaspirillum seropedicae]UMU21817.1 alpha/beta hydrolase [Herbaspirillum seropedicae]